MVNMKIFILTEGNQCAGFGHITRCTSLYQAFEAKGFQPELIVDGDDTIKWLLTDKKYEVFNWRTEHERLFNFIADADILIVDSYLAKYELYWKLSEVVKTPVYIDDNLRIDYPKGIVVNGTVFAEKFNYPDRNGVVYLLGSRYAMLRKEFWDVTEKKLKESSDTVMITLGGDDVNEMTPKILGLLNADSPELIKKVIIGRGFQNIDDIKELQDERTDLIYFPDAEGMKRAMLESDIAISAGGQTLYELVRIGVPTIAIAVADNQMNNIRGWLDAGLIEYAGWWNDRDTTSNVISCLERLRRHHIKDRIFETGRRLVDGQGAKRVVKECVGLSLAEDVTIREASYEDMYEVYSLSNERGVREFSFNSRRIPLEEHKRWFVQKLQDKNSLLLVAELGVAFIGQVRFDMIGSKAVVSISLKEEYRGIGIGKHVIGKAISYLKSHSPNVNLVRAYIMKNNLSSQNFFRDVGFRHSVDIVIKGQNACEFLLNI